MLWRTVAWRRGLAGNFVLNLVVKNFLLSFQLLVDEEEEFLEEDEEISKSESLTNNTYSGESQVSQASLGATNELPGGLSRSLKKSTAFHDRTSLEQQVSKIQWRQCLMSATLLPCLSSQGDIKLDMPIFSRFMLPTQLV